MITPDKCLQLVHLPGFSAGNASFEYPDGRLIRRGFLLIALLLFAGCDGSKLETVPVSGVVTLDGKPMPNILVVFNPTRGTAEDRSLRPGSNGLTDEDGRFELEMIDGPGAVPGEHVVSLICKAPTADPGSSKPESPHIVRLLSEAHARRLKFVVPVGGTDEAHFALESRPEPPPQGLAEPKTLAVLPGVGDTQPSRPARQPSQVNTSAAGSERSGGPRAATYGSSRDSTPWYVATISVWLIVILGCFLWWGFNVRRLRGRTS